MPLKECRSLPVHIYLSPTTSYQSTILELQLIEGFTRPPPLYEGHIPLSTPERVLLAFGSAFMSLYNPWRGG